MKYICAAMAFFGLLLGGSVFADVYVEEQSEASGVGEMEKFYSGNTENYLRSNGIDFSLEKMIDSIYSGDFEFSFSGVLASAADVFSGELKKNIAVAGILLSLSVLCGFLSGLNVFGKAAGTAAYYVCSCVICGICTAWFAHTVRRSAEAVGMMSDFVKVTAPVLTTLCAAGGELGTVSAVSPLMYGVSAVGVNAVNDFVLPAVYGIFAVNAVSCIGEGMDFGRIILFLKNISKWLMTFLMTLFSGVSVICGAAGGAINAAAGKTVKFAVGSFVPVVGGMLADSIDMVAACTSVVKRAAGAGGMCVIMLIFLSSASSLAVQTVLLKGTAALSSLICDEKTVKLLDGTADCISIVFAALCMCSFLFLIIITIMICGVGL